MIRKTRIDLDDLARICEHQGAGATIRNLPVLRVEDREDMRENGLNRLAEKMEADGVLAWVQVQDKRGNTHLLHLHEADEWGTYPLVYSMPV